MYDLTQLDLQDITDIGTTLRTFGKDADSLETVAARCVQFFYENLIDPTTGRSACALTRFFKTHPYGNLPGALQASADALASASIPDEVKCLTLLSSQGDRPEWSDRRKSQGHQAIPLTSESAVRQIPMIAQLIKSFGLDISYVLMPDTHLQLVLEPQTCNVFYIPTAAGSEFIPAQVEFVQPFGIKSVLGFGGMLPSGNLFAVILFSKVAIPQATAQLFRTLPLTIKMAMLPFDKGQLLQPLQVV
ncbi:MAG: hypothetical protein WBB01_02235 [Phormidesmis sp.]